MRAARTVSGVIAIWIMSVAVLTAPAVADKRVALVIGNSAYRNVTPLDNPKNDAKLMAETLRATGFTLVGGRAQIDLDKASFDSAVQSFGTQLIGADVALFYYAGHGVQVRDANYMVPVGANPTREADVDFQMVDVALVLRQMEGAGTKLNLVVLDACRNNPLAGRGLRATGGGLAQMNAPEGTLISYATQPGSVARDGDDGDSPYTKALAQAIRRPGLDIFQTFNEVGLAVKHATGGAQQPWVSSSPIDGSFYFQPPLPPGSGVQTPRGASTPPGPQDQAERVWGLTRDTKSQAILEDFIRQFGGTVYGSMARARLEEIRKSETAALAPPAPLQPAKTEPAADPAPTKSEPVSIPAAVLGANARLLGGFANWQAYVAAPDGKKVCYTLAGFSPGASKNPRDVVYAFVSTRPSEKIVNEIAFQLGYEVKKGASVSAATVGQQRYGLFGEGKGLWIEKPQEQAALVDAMRQNPDITITALSANGTSKNYTYSLKGFGSALDLASRECR